MSRMVQARVTDAQYNYLHYRAVEYHQGDLSQAVREAISWAEELERIIESESPGDAAVEMLARWRREYEESRDEVFMDQPDDK